VLTIRRTVRLCINPGADPDEPPRGPNGYAGTPAMRGLGRYYEFDITAAGEPDPITGYLADIKTIDRAARAAIYPIVTRACADDPGADPARVIRDCTPPLAAALAPIALRAIRWRLTPTYAVELENLDMPATDRPVLLRQRFDFAAAHRLHASELSDTENRRVFGKCNNPSGHGHNYQVEPCVAVPAGAGFGLAELERLTDELVIERFDHMNLNVDTPDFREGEGAIPSVENIARIAFEHLAPAIAEANAELRSITVWETDRTSCTYPG
jgi:6-pyruvoyltetrahydropterin/6-carboxytetrahydropterin synthase